MKQTSIAATWEDLNPKQRIVIMRGFAWFRTGHCLYQRIHDYHWSSVSTYNVGVHGRTSLSKVLYLYLTVNLNPWNRLMWVWTIEQERNHALTPDLYTPDLYTMSTTPLICTPMIFAALICTPLIFAPLSCILLSIKDFLLSWIKPMLYFQGCHFVLISKIKCTYFSIHCLKKFECVCLCSVHWFPAFLSYGLF